jgi:RNA polymerase sigma-70 factor (ECF subfamily)
MKETSDITKEKLADVFKTDRPRLLRFACYRMAGSDDAEDVLQETFLKLHARLSNADGGQINDLPSYMFRTLANVCTKWQTNANRIKTVPLDTRVDVADTAPDKQNEDDYKRIARLLTEIPDEQAEVIRLRIYGDNSFAQVSEILSLPLPTVKSRFLYGLEKLRRGMKQNN